MALTNLLLLLLKNLVVNLIVTFGIASIETARVGLTWIRSTVFVSLRGKVKVNT